MHPNLESASWLRLREMARLHHICCIQRNIVPLWHRGFLQHVCHAWRLWSHPQPPQEPAEKLLGQRHWLCTQQTVYNGICCTPGSFLPAQHKFLSRCKMKRGVNVHHRNGGQGLSIATCPSAAKRRAGPFVCVSYLLRQ